jgi:hypothetical protein
MLKSQEYHLIISSFTPDFFNPLSLPLSFLPFYR